MKKKANPKEQRKLDPSMMYSAIIEDLRLTFGLEKPTKQEQSTDDLPTPQEGTIEVTFFKHSKP